MFSYLDRRSTYSSVRSARSSSSQQPLPVFDAATLDLGTSNATSSRAYSSRRTTSRPNASSFSQRIKTLEKNCKELSVKNVMPEQLIKDCREITVKQAILEEKLAGLGQKKKASEIARLVRQSVVTLFIAGGASLMNKLM